MIRRLSLTVCLITSLAWAGPPPTIPATITIRPGRLAQVKAEAPTPIRWINTSEDLLDCIPDSSGKSAILLAPAAGRFRIAVYTADKDGPSEPAYCTVIVGDPTPPVPPTPPTPPVPPTPPAPIPAAGLHVMIVFDKAKQGDLPAGQQTILTGKMFRDLLDAKCVGDADGTKAYRIWPSTVDASEESAKWQAAYKRERKSLPWLIISDGKTGFEGPLPARVEDAVALINKYAGGN